MLTIRIIHEHRLNEEGVNTLMALSAAFKAQVDRLTAFVNVQAGAAEAVDAEATSAVKSALDAAGAPPAADAAPVEQPTA